MAAGWRALFRAGAGGPAVNRPAILGTANPVRHGRERSTERLLESITDPLRAERPAAAVCLPPPWARRHGRALHERSGGRDVRAVQAQQAGDDA